MVQRLFLDGINLHRRGMRVTQTVKFSAFVRANVAEPRLPLANMAMSRTKIAMHFAAGLRFPPARFVQFRRFLQYFQALHGEHSSASIIRPNRSIRFCGTISTPLLPAPHAALYRDNMVSCAASQPPRAAR